MLEHLTGLDCRIAFATPDRWPLVLSVCNVVEVDHPMILLRQKYKEARYPDAPLRLLWVNFSQIACIEREKP